jgi:5-(carboxyamino)imidazole ribonucleotide synthase
MLGLAGIPLGCQFRFLDPAGPLAPAAVVGEVLQGPLDNLDALLRLADGADVVTYEFENLPAPLVAQLEAQGVTLFPSSRALALAQDRWEEKQYFQQQGIPIPPTHPVETKEALEAACAEIGFPCVVKTRRQGYDGKGQGVIRSLAQVSEVWDALGGGGVPLVVEGWVAFDEEFSIVAARGQGGEVVVWPACQNTHEGGILHTTRVVPDGALSEAQRTAFAQGASIARRLVTDLGYVGVLAVEFFRVGDGVLANEMAPRVHNSGHWTQDGAVTSQFENHIRAVVGLPLGAVDLRVGPGGGVGMVNYIGEVPSPGLALEGRELQLEGPPRVFRKLHLYGKAARPGRKLGHLNVWSDDLAALDAELQRQVAQRP